MKRSGMILVLAAVMCVPGVARASSMDDPCGAPTDAVEQAQATPSAPSTVTRGVLLAAESPAAAADPQQTTSPEAAELPARHTGFRTLVRDLGGDFGHLPSRDSLFVAAAGGGAALAFHSVDSTFNEHVEDTSFFNAGDRLGNTYSIMAATFGVYAVGRLTGHNRIAHVTMDLVRAQVVSEVLVQTLKVTVRRDRPDASNGFSFPSGHAAVTFATAAVLQRHHGFMWALPAYGLASYVAVSRLHDNVHYVSDVVFGAAVGTLAGRTVTRHGASNFALVPAFVPGGAGVFFVRSHRDS